MPENHTSQNKQSRIVQLLVLLVPVVAVLCAAFGFAMGRYTAIGALPSYRYNVAESLVTQTPFQPLPTQTSTPKPTPIPRRPPVSLEDYEELFAGVYYKRQESNSPRPYVAHIVVVDLNKRNIKLMVTPEKGLGQTTSAFLETYGLSLAINGDGWEENSNFDPTGFAASKGKVYSEDSPEPTIYISKNGDVKIGGRPPGKVWQAISGSHTLVRNGRLSEKMRTCALELVFCHNLAPRTSIGISAGNYLIIIVVEGPPSAPGDGLTLEELARLHLQIGSVDAIAMDGGGSTTLVMDRGGSAHILNNPTDGTERVVANHLGIFAKSLANSDD